MFYFRDISTLMLFLIHCTLFLDFTSHGLHLDPCESGWFTVEENANNITLLSCKNISSTDSIVWSINRFQFGRCGSLHTSCSVNVVGFNLTRPKDTESNVILFNPASQTSLSNKTFSCNPDSSISRPNCSVNLIYRASNVSCFVAFSQEQRNLIGHCSVNKFYTSRGNYSFVLLESNGIFSEEIDNAFYNTTTVKFNEASGVYYNATSQMKKRFPASDGIYTYMILFYPSTGPVNATLASNNVINRPKQKPSLMCSPKIGEYLLEGERTNCICSAPNLGQPSGRLLLNHTYTHRLDGNYGVNNLSMTIYNINRTYNGTIIKCDLDWARDETDHFDLYTVLVAYGPDNVSMSNVGLINFNPNQTKSVNVSCFASEAYPELYFNWSRLCTRSSDGHCSLIADPTLDGATITCTVSNPITNVSVQVNQTLIVHYAPAINIRPIAIDNQCLIQERDDQCLVQEGDRVHFECTADSNPPPAIFTWEKVGWNVAILNIASANRTTDHGIFNCFVQTGNPKNDSRLPLNNSFQLSVLVLYKAEILNFNLNSANNSLMVNESNDVVITCQSSGMPTPQMIIKKEINDEILSKVDKGKPSLQLQITTVQYNLTNAQCEHTGIFRCQVNNDIQGTDWRSVSLFVLCKPRYAAGERLVVNYVGHPVSRTLKFLGYPKPDMYNVTFLGPTRNITSPEGVNGDIFKIICFTTLRDYVISCNITIANITTKEQEGYYRMWISNAIGTESVEFQVKINVNEEGKLNIAAIVGGVCAAFAMIALIIATYLFVLKFRKKGMSSKPTTLRYNTGQGKSGEDSSKEKIIEINFDTSLD